MYHIEHLFYCTTNCKLFLYLRSCRKDDAYSMQYIVFHKLYGTHYIIYVYIMSCALFATSQICCIYEYWNTYMKCIHTYMYYASPVWNQVHDICYVQRSIYEMYMFVGVCMQCFSNHSHWCASCLTNRILHTACHTNINKLVYLMHVISFILHLEYHPSLWLLICSCLHTLCMTKCL